MCFFCSHLRDNGRGLRCDAFPDRIPREIVFGTGNPMSRRSIVTPPVDHTVAYPGDHGIRFAPIDEQAAEQVRRRFPNSAGVKNGRA